MINITSIYHETKSKYSYMYDKETLHIRIRTAKNDVDSIRLIYGDVFNWGQVTINNETKHGWKHQHHGEDYLTLEYSTEYFDYWFYEIKPKYRRVKYGFIIEKDDEKILYGVKKVVDLNKNPESEYDMGNLFNYPFLNEIDMYKAPDWASKTIWYQIFPERFANGNTFNDPTNVLDWGSVENVSNNMFFGGDLEGVIEKLDYVKALGANGIYFTPIFKSPSTHKYDTEDYFEIDPQFGDLETMKRLVKEAHKRGIKIMLDAVFNHCGDKHPFWLDVLKNQEQSIYKDYFHIKKFPIFNGKPEDFRFIDGISELNFDTFAFTRHMPKWNTENPIVKDYLLNVARYWIVECDIDGWRLDVSNEVDHSFWRAFNEVCLKEKEDFFIVGENWDDSNPWLRGDQLHAVMNYEFTYPCWNFFGRQAINAEQFKLEINRVLTLYPKNVAKHLFNQLDSHDTERLLSICNENIDQAKLAYLFQLTFAGSPSIYYGGEIGLSGKHDPDCRRCMIWENDKQNKDIYNHIHKLINLRKNHESFRAVDIKWIESIKNTIIFTKESNDEKIMIFINNSDESITINTPEILVNIPVTDIYHNKKETFNKQLTLAAYEFKIIKY